MSAWDIVCACLGVPLFGAVGFIINGAMSERARLDAEHCREAVISDAIEAEYARRDVRRALARIDLPRD